MSSRWRALVVAVLLLAAYSWFLIRNTAFSVGGSDSSGYINTARRLVLGTLVARPRALDRLALPEDFTPIVTPLGFVKGPRPGTMAPYYPFGFPSHMAAAASLVGWKKGPFLVSPIAALLCLALLYSLARELSLSPAWAAAATAVFAVWPVFVGQAIQPMSDAAATFWSLASILCAFRARRRRVWALAAGAALGVAVLVRPANLLLAIPMAFALPLSASAIAFLLLGGAPFAAALALLDIHCYGSAFQSGYRQSGLLEAIELRNFSPRFRHYGGWILRTLTPIVPLGWMGVAFDRKAGWRDRALLLSWFAAFFLFYCLYEPYDSFWFVRFLLPGAPALILGATIAVRDLAQRVPPMRAGVGALLLLLVVFLAEGRTLQTTHVLNTAEYESIYPRICAWAARSLPPDSVVLAMAASGALEYYTGLSYARWDLLAPERFADLRSRAENRGFRLFALLFPFEAQELPRKAPGDWRQIGQLREVGLWQLR